MNRHFFPAVSLLMGVALLTPIGLAQPVTPNTLPSSTPSFSLAELERFIEGRTLLDVDLKDATFQEVAAALSRASGWEITTRPSFAPPPVRPEGAPRLSAPVAPLFTLSAKQTPFWETLREWQLAARRASDAEGKVDDLRILRRVVRNSVGLQKQGEEWLLQADNNMADGRGVVAWPFLIIGTDLRRSQEAKLSEDGLREIESLPVRPELLGQRPAVAAPPITKAPKAPVPEEERWLDRLVLNTQVYIDPKIVPTGLHCIVEEAIDDKGNDLRLGEDDVLSHGGTNYGFTGVATSIPIQLRSLPKMGKRLVRLRGVLRFSIVTRSQHWETTDLKTPVEDTLQQNGGDFKVKFGGIEQQGENWVAKFSAQSQGAHLKQFWEENYNNRLRFGASRGLGGILSFEGVPSMRLVDENGRSISSRFGASGVATLSSKKPTDGPTPNISPDVSPVPPDVDRNWTFTEDKTFSFSPSPRPLRTLGAGINTTTQGVGSTAMGRPVKFIVDFPIERREVSVPFEFTNLPLPPS